MDEMNETAKWQKINILQHIYRCTNCGLLRSAQSGMERLDLPSTCPTCGKEMRNPQVIMLCADNTLSGE